MKNELFHNTFLKLSNLPVRQAGYVFIDTFFIFTIKAINVQDE